MKLTNFTQISFQVLLFAAANTDRLITIDELQESLQVSRGHLMKVVHNLTKTGFLNSTRGRGGGLRLGRDASEINLAEVLRNTESSFDSPAQTAEGAEEGATNLPDILQDAMNAYLDVLQSYTLDDVDMIKKLTNTQARA